MDGKFPFVGFPLGVELEAAAAFVESFMVDDFEGKLKYINAKETTTVANKIHEPTMNKGDPS